MKLTKGKIAKLYNIKKQSLKKLKKNTKNHNIKTFRNKKRVNLARKSLKSFHYIKHKGGDDTSKYDIKKNTEIPSRENSEEPLQ